MINKETEFSRLWWLQVAGRRLAAAAGELIWPHTTEHMADGLARAREMLAVGGGIVVLINHFSLRDGHEALKDIVFTQPVFRDRQMTLPMAAHRYRPVLGVVGEMLGMKIVPVVNEHSVNCGFAPQSRRGEGNLKYVKHAADVLSAGGVVLLAPQAGREYELYPVRHRTVEFFIRNMERQCVPRVGYLLVGFGIRGETEYTKERVGGHNTGRLFEVKIGQVFLQDEIRKKATAEGMTVDQWVYKQFEPLVPPVYVWRPREESNPQPSR